MRIEIVVSGAAIVVEEIMRILLANESARPHRGGVNRMVVESCEWLQRAGHSIALAYFDGGPAEVSCKTYSWPNTGDKSLISATWERILAEFRPEVVQLHHDAQPHRLGIDRQIGPGIVHVRHILAPCP